MKADKKRINIMTSCDENYAKLVPVQLLSIADNILVKDSKSEYEVYYYFFHSRVSKKIVDALCSYCNTLGIVFIEVYIADVEPYLELKSKGGLWAHEAYFSFECHRHLPLEVDRILYIDAADVLILGNIDEYYFSDFEGCSIIATPYRYKSNSISGLTTFKSEDLNNPTRLPLILRGVFNSGSYIMNVTKMRQENVEIQDYIALKNSLESIDPSVLKNEHWCIDHEKGEGELYFGDQGLLSVAFLGDIKYFDYPKIRNLWYMPYNFCLWFFDRSPEICGGNPWYIPRIVHFIPIFKPWQLTEKNIKDLKPGQWPFYKIYRMYANQVPFDFSNSSM